MRLNALATIALALLPAVSASAQDAEKHLLRFHFEKGFITHTVFDQNITSTMNMGGQTMVMKMQLQLFGNYRVQSVEDGKGTLLSTVERIKANIENPMTGKQHYDSKDKDSGGPPAMLGGIDKMVGAENRMVLTPEGKVLDISLDDAISDNLERVGMDFEQTMTQMTLLLPEKPIAIGETWTTSTESKLTGMGNMKVVITNKLLAVDDDHAQIAQSMKFDLGDAEMPFGVKMDLEKASGKSTIDLRTGLFSAMEMELHMKVAGGDGDMKLNSTTVVQMKMHEYTPEPEKKTEKAADTGKDGDK